MKLDDLFNIIMSDNPIEKIKENEDAIFNFIPELKICKGFEQRNPWHIYDVYDHTLMVLSLVPQDLIMRLSALFHDIGKPQVYFEDGEGIGHFRGHWTVSRKIFEQFAETYDLNKELKEKVSLLILYHDKNFEDLYSKENLDILEQFDHEAIIRLFEFKKADLKSQNPKFHYLLEEFEQQKEEMLLFKSKNTHIR